MPYDSKTKFLSGIVSANDIVGLINDEIPKYFESRIVYWRNNTPTHWPAAWSSKLSAVKSPPLMSVPSDMKGAATSYINMLASLDQMFKIWSMIRNIRYIHVANRGYTNGGAATSTHTDGNAKAFLTENSYSISGRDKGYELTGQALQNDFIKKLLEKLQKDIDTAATIEYRYADPCHSNCHGSCHSSCHSSHSNCYGACHSQCHGNYCHSQCHGNSCHNNCHNNCHGNCHNNCHDNCHDNCHGSGGWR